MIARQRRRSPGVAPHLRRRGRQGGTVVVLTASVAVVAAAVTVAMTRGAAPPRPLSRATAAAYTAAAQRLAQRYVEAAWCAPMEEGTLGTVPRWPHELATLGATPALTVGPTEGRIRSSSGTAVHLDVSDARAILPGARHSWSFRPRFCVAQFAYPRLVTTGGTTHPSYGPLPHRLGTLDQIFDRFPRYLGQVERIGVPTTVEVAYQLVIGDGPPENFHLWWVTTLGMEPMSGLGWSDVGNRRRRPELRLDTWDEGGHGAVVTVRHDVPVGPVVVRSSPPGSGP